MTATLTQGQEIPWLKLDHVIINALVALMQMKSKHMSAKHTKFYAEHFLYDRKFNDLTEHTFSTLFPTQNPNHKPVRKS